MVDPLVHIALVWHDREASLGAKYQISSGHSSAARNIGAFYINSYKIITATATFVRFLLR